MAVAAIDRLIDSSPDLGMDQEPKGRRLYKYHSYTTPASVQPRSPSPSSYSPSPYVVNFKGRRAPPLDKGSSSKFRDPGPSVQQVDDAGGKEKSSCNPVVLEKSFEGGQEPGFFKARNGCYQDDIVGKALNDKHFLMVSPGGMASSEYGEEFFDAPESPFEGGDETSSQSEYTAAEAEAVVVEELSPGPEDDAERCRKAEEALGIVLEKLAEGGLAVPARLLGKGVEKVREEVEDLDIAGQLLIKRMVEAAVARGAARAEVEESLEGELENKSREVIRLRDKVRYNELVNREMSQRNQEAIEMARNKRRARRTKIRWALAAASAGVVVGLSAALVYRHGDFQLWKAKPAVKDSA